MALLSRTGAATSLRHIVVAELDATTRAVLLGRPALSPSREPEVVPTYGAERAHAYFPQSWTLSFQYFSGCFGMNMVLVVPSGL